MTWLNQEDCETLRMILRYSPSQYLVGSVDGRILWANPAFCEWSKYTLPELLKITWMQISVEDDSLAADIELANGLNEYNVSYTVQKRYIPKSDKPQIGNLHVMRFPASGQIKFCFCRWEPLVNGTAQAFELAIESNRKIMQEMTELTKRIDTLTGQTDEQRFTLNLVAMVAKYPKVCLGIVFAVLSLGGFDAILSTLQRLGYIQQPPVVVKEVGK